MPIFPVLSRRMAMSFKSAIECDSQKMQIRVNKIVQQAKVLISELDDLSLILGTQGERIEWTPIVVL